MDNDAVYTEKFSAGHAAFDIFKTKPSSLKENVRVFHSKSLSEDGINSPLWHIYTKA